MATTIPNNRGDAGADQGVSARGIKYKLPTMMVEGSWLRKYILKLKISAIVLEYN